MARTTPDQFFTLGLFVDEGIYATVLLKFYCEKNDKCFFFSPPFYSFIKRLLMFVDNMIKL